MRLKYEFNCVDVGGQSMAVPMNAGQDCPTLLKLNSTAAFILECLRRETDAEEIVDKMTEKYDVSSREARMDVLDLLAQLRSEGLLIE